VVLEYLAGDDFMLPGDMPLTPAMCKGLPSGQNAPVSQILTLAAVALPSSAGRRSTCIGFGTGR
jgi:hypothetical protein